LDARIVERGRILLVGMSFYGDPFARASAWDEENEIGSLWKRFSAYLSAHPSAIGGRADRGERWYELHIALPETAKTGRYEVFSGVEVCGLESIPIECSAKILPAADYAVVTVRGGEMSGDWMGRLFSVVVPDLGRAAAPGFSFELYDSRFKGMDKLMESELEYWIPLLAGGSGR
jgi:predicted transcriptional regulator YdeE